MKQTRVSIFGPTKSDRSKSMHIYTERIFESLRNIENKRYSFELHKLTDCRLPLMKNVISKEFFYPIYAFFKRGAINHITDHSYGSLAFWLNKKNTVVTCHDLTPLVFREQSSLLGQIRFRINILVMKRVANIITVSKSTAKQLREIINYNGNIHVIYNGIDRLFVNITDKTRLIKIKNKYKIIDKNIYLLHISSSYPTKNIELILRTMDKLPPYYHLIIVGAFTAKQESEIAKLKLANRILRFENLKTAELCELYNVADIFLFPSLYEGFGLPILEAMACACPVICSNTTSLPEVGGDAPIYINPKSETELGEAILRVTNDDTLRRQMIEKGQRNIKRFSWEKTASKLSIIYDKICSNEKVKNV